MNASWNGRHAGSAISSRRLRERRERRRGWRRGTRRARRVGVEQLDAALDPIGRDARERAAAAPRSRAGDRRRESERMRLPRSIQARYSLTSGVSAACAAAPSARAPSASIRSSRSGDGPPRSSSRPRPYGTQRVRSCGTRRRRASQSAETPWPVAYSGRVGVVQVGDLLVPVAGARAAQVGARDERLLASRPRAPPGTRTRGRRRFGSGARSLTRNSDTERVRRRESARRAVGQAPVARAHAARARPSPAPGSRRTSQQLPLERHVDRLLPRSALPHASTAVGSGLAVRLAVRRSAALLAVARLVHVVAPADGHRLMRRSPAATSVREPHRRREEALRRAAILGASSDSSPSARAPRRAPRRRRRRPAARAACRGIRKPVRYQFDGRTQPGSSSCASWWPGRGPTRSSSSASTSRSRTSSGAAAASTRRSPPPSQNSASACAAATACAARPRLRAAVAAAAPDRCSSAARSAFSSISRASTSSRTSSGQR